MVLLPFVLLLMLINYNKRQQRQFFQFDNVACSKVMARLLPHTRTDLLIILIPEILAL